MSVMMMTDVCQLMRLLLLLSASFVVSLEHNTSSDSALRPQFVYHDEPWLVTFLHNITEAFPHLTHLYSIGTSVQGLLLISMSCFLLDFCLCDLMQLPL